MPEATMPPAAKGPDRKDMRLLEEVVLTGDMIGCKSQLTESVVVLALAAYKPLKSCNIKAILFKIFIKYLCILNRYRVT